MIDGLYFWFTVKELKTSVKYTIVVHAYSIDGKSTPSAPIEYKIVSEYRLWWSLSSCLSHLRFSWLPCDADNSGNMKGQRAITAGVVGSILFFVAAIILSVCTVKICNKRKQRKMEKGECYSISKQMRAIAQFILIISAPWYEGSRLAIANQ